MSLTLPPECVACVLHRDEYREDCEICERVGFGRWTAACAIAEERARVVAWLRGKRHDRSYAQSLADEIERGEHDDASAGGAQEPRSGAEGGGP